MSRASVLLGLYPACWRERYGNEIADLLAQEPMRIATIVDAVRGALFAHLHPELAEPTVVDAASGATLRLRPRLPIRALAALALLLAVATYALGATVVFAWSPAECPPGYDKRLIDRSSQIGFVLYIGDFDCVRDRPSPNVLRLREQREIGIYLKRPGVRVFHFDFVQQQVLWLGLVPR